MYERFTDRARKVMQLANQEAQRFRHEYVGTEHVLLGLVAEGAGVAANVLKNLGIDFQKVRSEVEKIAQPGSNGESLTGRLPQTPRTKKVIEYAIEEARNLNHNYVGTEHLLLGLLRESQGLAAQVLTNLGLKLEGVRAEVLKLLGHNTGMIAGNAPDHPQEEVFRIPKSLKPWATETYPVSDEVWDDTPAALDPDVTKAGTGPTIPPDLTAEQLRVVKDRVRYLNEKKDEFVAEQDFALAARCRDEADALARLLMWYEWRHKSH